MQIPVESQKNFLNRKSEKVAALGFAAAEDCLGKLVKSVKKEGIVHYDIFEDPQGMLTARPLINTFTITIPDGIRVEGDYFPYEVTWHGELFILDDGGEVSIDVQDNSARAGEMDKLEAFLSMIYKIPPREGCE